MQADNKKFLTHREFLLKEILNDNVHKKYPNTDFTNGVEDCVKKKIISNFYKKLKDLVNNFFTITDEEILKIFETVNIPGHAIPITIFINHPEFLRHLVSLAKHYLDTTNNTKYTKCSIIEFLIPGISSNGPGTECKTVDEVINFLQKYIIIEGKPVNPVDWLNDLKKRNNQIRNDSIKKVNSQKKEMKEIQMTQEIKMMEEKQQTIEEKKVSILEEYSAEYIQTMRYAMPYLDIVVTVCENQKIVPVYTIRSLLSILPPIYKKSGVAQYGSEEYASASGSEITMLFMLDIIPEIILALYKHYRPNQDQTKIENQINNFKKLIKEKKYGDTRFESFKITFIEGKFGVQNLTYEWKKEDVAQMTDFFNLLGSIYMVEGPSACIDVKSRKIKEHLELKHKFLDIEVEDLKIDLINVLLEKAIESLLTKQECLVQRFKITYELLVNLGIADTFNEAIKQLKYYYSHYNHYEIIASLSLLNNTAPDILNKLMSAAETKEILKGIFVLDHSNLEKLALFGLILKPTVLEIMLKNSDLKFSSYYQFEIFINLVETMSDEKAELFINSIKGWNDLFHFHSNLTKTLETLENLWNTNNKTKRKIAMRIIQFFASSIFEKYLCRNVEQVVNFIYYIEKFDKEIKHNIQNIILKFQIENKIFDGDISIKSFVSSLSEYQFKDKLFLQKLIKNIAIKNSNKEMKFAEFCALCDLTDQLDEDISFKKQILSRISEYIKNDRIKEALEKEEVFLEVLSLLMYIKKTIGETEEINAIKKIFANFLDSLQKQQVILHRNKSFFQIFLFVANYSDLSEQNNKELIKSLVLANNKLPCIILKKLQEMNNSDLKSKIAEMLIKAIIDEKKIPFVRYELMDIFKITDYIINDVTRNEIINELMEPLKNLCNTPYHFAQIVKKIQPHDYHHFSDHMPFKKFLLYMEKEGFDKIINDKSDFLELVRYIIHIRGNNQILHSIIEKLQIYIKESGLKKITHDKLELMKELLIETKKIIYNSSDDKKQNNANFIMFITKCLIPAIQKAKNCPNMQKALIDTSRKKDLNDVTEVEMIKILENFSNKKKNLLGMIATVILCTALFALANEIYTNTNK